MQGLNTTTSTSFPPPLRLAKSGTNKGVGGSIGQSDVFAPIGEAPRHQVTDWRIATNRILIEVHFSQFEDLSYLQTDGTGLLCMAVRGSS